MFQEIPPVLTDASFIDDVIAVFRKHGKRLVSEDPYCGLEVDDHFTEETVKSLEALKGACD